MNRSRRDVLCGIVSSVATAAFAGCGHPESAAGGPAQFRAAPSRPIRAVATTGMVADLVRQVGGDRVTLTQLCGAGVDPHLYKATRDDVREILAGDIFFVSGLHLEGKLATVLARVGARRPVIAVAERLPADRLLAPPEFEGAHDPHVWNDVSAWAEAASVVAEALAEFDPSHVAGYATRAAAYRDQLAQLHAYGQRCIATVPARGRVLVTSHDAFHYFGRAYGLEVRGVQGLSTESEAGLARINDLVDLLVARDVRAVFVESSVPRKSIDALVEGAQSRGKSIVIGGELFSDAMGSPGSYEGTYIGMLDHNLTLVARGLGGTAPERGFRGKLSVSAHPHASEKAPL
jgi:manganese/zinc/iron transport system substrate-binding protein